MHTVEVGVFMPSLLTLLALAAPGLVSHALAFAPTAGAGVAPNRTEVYHMPAQLRLRHTPAWEEFTQGEGAGWLARFDEREATARRAWGPGIPLGDVDHADAVEASLRTFLSRNAGIVGVDPDLLVLRNIGYSATMDTWYVDFDRLISGAPVWGGGVTARVRGGELVLFGVSTYPSVESLPKPMFSAADAERVAQLQGPAALAEHTGLVSKLVALPWDRAGGLDVRLCWEVRSHTESPIGNWVTHVDAASGERLNTYNEISTFTGTIQGTTHTRTLDGDYTTSALPLGKLTGADGTTQYASEAGVVTLSDSTTWTATLSSSYLTVRNDSGAEGALPVTSSSLTWTSASATQAEIDTYKFVFDVRAWAQEMAPDNGMGIDTLTAKVNVSGNCNAYYDGNLNFYDEGGGCNNTGEIADVVYHEWGHGFHYYELEAGVYDPSISEGIADTLSTLMTHDSRIGPYFYTSGGSIRDTSPDYVYPTDVTGESHQDGLIFAGAMWDLWDELNTTYGETRADSGSGWRTASLLLANGLHAGPTIPESYDEFVLADDDNNNTVDGTPHFCEILEAFGRHGLGPGGTSSVIGIDHTPIPNQPSNTPIAFDGAVVNLAPGCTEFTLADVVIHYSTDGGGTWLDAGGALSGDAFTGDLAGFPGGTIVNYYVSATALDGTEVMLPSGGDIAPYTFYVGQLEEVWCASFDDDDGGFTHELLDGRETEGADDWIWDRPTGLAGDPSDAYTGRKIWGNDLGGGNFNGEYQAGIQNRLSSPAIDVGTNTELILQYRRWLSVEDGYYDQARVLANDGEVWSNHATAENPGNEQTEDHEWMLHTLRLSRSGNPITLGWEIQSDQGMEFGGWNIDDVCLYAPAADMPDDSGDSDSNGDSAGDGPTDSADNSKITVGHSCGCASAPGVPWPAAGLFVALLATRRRQSVLRQG